MPQNWFNAASSERNPTLALKLDFAKAFDSVDWECLQTVMECRGFPDRWCSWIKATLTTSRSTVLVNGCPGLWINCKRGLQQGDPLSPYLFLIVADVLQVLIKSEGHGIRHPLVDQPCPMLQYADDTLLLIRAEIADVRWLRECLDLFAQATGLKINFHKSKVVPMLVQPEKQQELLQILQCQQGAFPQTYLGLPLSNCKLHLSAFAPLIAKVDRYLAGWKAMLLSSAAWVVLINAMLDGLPTYAMGALALPPGVK